MPSKVLTTSPPTSGENVDRVLLDHPPLDPAVLIVVRYLQAQIDDLRAQLESS